MSRSHGLVVSLFDESGVATDPWWAGGYDVVCIDSQHTDRVARWHPVSGAVKTTIGACLPPGIFGAMEVYDLIHSAGFHNADVVFISGFPPCTDLSAAGARHWEKKSRSDPEFQERAARLALVTPEYATMLKTLRDISPPWYVENPKGALSRLWRKPDHSFHPYQYGGYIPADQAEHRRYPDIIPPFDAYPKHTNIWSGGGFVMPEHRPVPYEAVTLRRADGSTVSGSPQWAKLGGKSERTKRIRSETPRGWAEACYTANAPHLREQTERN